MPAPTFSSRLPSIDKSSKGLIAVAIVLFILLWKSFSVVPAGFRGVESLFGKVDPMPLAEGLHMKNPLAEVYKIDVRIRRVDSQGEAASRDLQTVHTAITLNYRINPDLVATLFSQVGAGYENTVIDPAIQESFKAVTALYSAEELITKREEVRGKIRDLLETKVDARALRALYLDEVSITNFRFSPKFSEAIESKQESEQLALKATRDLERIQIEAKQKIAQAEAEAAALRAQRAEITPDLLRLREIEVMSRFVDKWNGVPPQTLATGALPFLDIGKRPVDR